MVPGQRSGKVGAAVEAVLAPLRTSAASKSQAAKQMDKALEPVLRQHSKTSVKGYLWSNVHYCLRDGTFHSSRSSLTEHLASGKTLPRATAKQMPNAKLLLRKMDNRV